MVVIPKWKLWNYKEGLHCVFTSLLCIGSGQLVCLWFLCFIHLCSFSGNVLFLPDSHTILDEGYNLYKYYLTPGDEILCKGGSFKLIRYVPSGTNIGFYLNWFVFRWLSFVSHSDKPEESSSVKTKRL